MTRRKPNYRLVVEDFMAEALYEDMGIRELAEIIARVFDFDVDKTQKLIEHLKDEQEEYLREWYGDEGEEEKLQEQLNKIDRA